MTLLPAMADAAEITHETYRGKNNTFELIGIEGEIEAGDVEKFRQISLRYPSALVVLDSNGGKLFPAIEIGKIIKISRYNTLVPNDAVCASACALMWVAGDRRLLAPNGHVGFHASYYDNNGRLEESGVANALIGNYLTLLDLREKAIAFATSAPPNKFLWLTTANRQAAGIDFEEFAPQATSTPAPPQAPTLPPPPPGFGAPRLVSPPPVTVSNLAPGLPSYLPSRLSQTGENWVRYAGNAFYDVNSIIFVTDIQGQLSGRKVWTIIDQSQNPESK